MKKLIFTLTLIVVSQLSFAQLEIEDLSKEPKIEPTPYNGEFMTFNGVYEKEKKAGVVGEKVTLIDVSPYNIYLNEDAMKNYKSVGYNYEELFKNKTFEVVEYKYDVYDILKIKNDSSAYIWKVGSSDEYVFNKYLEKLKTRFEGKIFISLHKEIEFENLNGQKLFLKGDEDYEITNVKLAKLKYDYSIVFTLNDSVQGEFKTGFYDQPRLFNGEIYASNDRYINLLSGYSKVTFIEKNEFKTFSHENRTYLDKIRNRDIVIGMSEKQCRWAIGTPTKSLKNIAGYDVVLTYGDFLYLYFQNDILKLIR